MKVLTINPITINGKHISKPSEYLNADGGDDFYDADGDFYGFDASGKPTTKAEKKQFQIFANSKGESLVIDGLWGAKSEKAWGKWGADFVKSLSGTPTVTPIPTTPTGTTPTTPTAEPTKDEKIFKAKLGQIWDKNKGWITSDKAKDVLKSLLAGEGVMGFLNTLLGGGSGADTTTTDGTTTTETTPTGMSKGAKIGIAIGGIALLGIIIYVATRPKTTK